MMELKVTVLLPGMPEAINRLADAITSNTANRSGAKLLDSAASTSTASAQTAVVTAAPAVTPTPAVPATASTAPMVQAAPVAPVPAAPVAPVPAAPVAPVAPVAPSPVVPTSTPAPAAPVQAAATQASARKYTLHDISIAGAALIENGKMGDLSRLLNSFGVQAITQLDESRYEAFAAGMRSLGASI